MASWLRRRFASGPADAAPLEAYREGRRDERDRSADTVDEARASRTDLRAAYDRGRREEALRRRGSPVVAFVVGLLAIFAVLVLVLAIRDGSFGQAGSTIDNFFNSAETRATAPVRGAENQAGSALVNAGSNLKQKAGSPAS